VQNLYGGVWGTWPVVGLVIALLIDISPAGGPAGRVNYAPALQSPGRWCRGDRAVSQYRGGRSSPHRSGFRCVRL
jgi:hypothetical protein